MNKIQPSMWRKGLLLSATFFCASLLIISCKKKNHSIGQNNIDQNELLQSGGIDTFSLITYTVREDSIVADNPALAILGSYNDPVFGTVNSEIYTQFRLPAINPDFGDLSTITIDSVILGLEYAGFYGESGYQTVEVFEITDPLGMNIDSTYYSSDVMISSGTDLVVTGQGSLYFNTSNPTIIDTVEVSPQLRIPIDTNFAWNIINETANNPTVFEDNENFLDFFKGFLIRTNNGAQALGEGGLFYFNLTDTDSELTFYYTQAGVKKAYSLVINSQCADFNHVDIGQSMTVQNVIDNESGQSEFYAQAFSCRARIQIPGLSNIPPNAVIHKATLELPVQNHSLSPYGTGSQINVSTFLSSDYNELPVWVNLGSYDSYNKQFTIDLRAYAQAVVSGDIENHGLILDPILFNTSGDRIIFNGPETTNKSKPRFNIIYTEF